MKNFNFRRLFLCFVEWQENNGTMCLSVIPWWVWLWDKITFTNFTKYVPPWKIKIGD